MRRNTTMKWMVCQNNDPKSKYFKGKKCYEETLVDETTKSVLCWKCTAVLAPPTIVQNKTTGYPRGWKFMNEFVDKDGNVYHKGEIQETLFGTLPPTEIKDKPNKPTVRKKRSDVLEDKVLDKYRQIKSKSKSKSKKKK